MHSTDSTEALQSQGNFQTCLDAKEQAFGEACGDGLAIGFDVWKGRDCWVSPDAGIIWYELGAPQR